MPDLEYKAFPAEWEGKLLEQDHGGFEGHASLFNVRDDIGDSVQPGAFGHCLKRFIADGFIAMNHAWDALPIGHIAEAREDDRGLWLKALYHSTEAAQAARRVAAERMAAGHSVGLSIGFMIAEGGATPTGWGRKLTKLDLFEVSQVNVPMLKPARIAAVKGHQDQDLELKGAVASHSTATSDASWDGPAAEAALSNDAGAAVYRRAFAWGPDPDKDADTKAAWRFIHHMVSGGTPGAANLVACSAGIAVLNGGRGGTTIPAGDRRGVWNHLARHLRDGDREPPELRGWSAEDLEEAARFATALQLVEACAQLKAAGNVSQARAMLALLEPALADLGALTTAKSVPPAPDLARLRNESRRRLVRLALREEMRD